MFEGSPLLALPLVALAMFLLVFVAVTLRLVARGAAPYEAHARRMLEDEDGGAS
jgi:hypothetical protein